MRNLAELNINAGGHPVTRRVPTDAMFAKLEREIDGRLPKGYRQLLIHANGGHPELDSFVPDSGKAAEIWSIDTIYFLDENEHSPDSVLVALDRWKTISGEKRLPIARDGGNNQIFLDFTSDPATVGLAIVDDGIFFRKISDNFEDFVDSLQSNPDFI